MTDERWPRVKALFQAAVERPIEERDAFLAAATGDDDALRREVESLLTSDTSDVSFLDQLPVASEIGAGRCSRSPRRRRWTTRRLTRSSPRVFESVPTKSSPRLVRAPWARSTARRDTKLNRDVALKVLPELFALDPDRLARFTREAQLLATLNHPNIAAIYGLEESNGAQALVLELVDGPTLADRIARRADAAGRGVDHRASDCRRAGSGAREGHHSSRPQAGEYQDRPRWRGQGARLRAGEGVGRRPTVRPLSVTEADRH